MLTESLQTDSRKELDKLFRYYEDLYPNLKDQAEFRVAIIRNSNLTPKEKAREFKEAHKLFKEQLREKRLQINQKKYIKQEL